MVKFIEWLRVKKGIVIEGPLPIGYESIPDIIPEEGQAIIIMNKEPLRITNDNTYYVMRKYPDRLLLIPKKALSGSEGIDLGEQMSIYSREYPNLINITHLLKRSEIDAAKSKIGIPSIFLVWMLGKNAQKWISNREKTKKPTIPSSEPTSGDIRGLRATLTREEPPKEPPEKRWQSLFEK